MEREKTSTIPSLLCTADKDAAVHGSSAAGGTGPTPHPGGTSSPSPTGTSSGERAFVPTQGSLWAEDGPLLIGGATKSGPPGPGDEEAHHRRQGRDAADVALLTQAEGDWPVEHPLPLPAWDAAERAPLVLASVGEFVEFCGSVESHLQKLLEEHNYNTVGNFISLYQGFKQSSCSYLAEFFQSYAPPITPKHHTCVGLALELWKKLCDLDDIYPGFTYNLYLVSCEESIGISDEYPGLYNDIDYVTSILEKEHVLLALKIDLCGRTGVMLFDPGYNVARVITVMLDQKFPHTGWFTQSNESNIIKEYKYNFSPTNPCFIEWHDRTTRNAKVDEINSLIYVQRPYLTAVDVTERRNLVYNFRTYLSRDQKGHPIAGIYFKLKENSDEFTIFYQDDGKRKVKFNFSEFKDTDRINEHMLNIIEKCNNQMNLKKNELLRNLRDIDEILSNKTYMRQLLDINSCINDMAEIN